MKELDKRLKTILRLETERDELKAKEKEALHWMHMAEQELQTLKGAVREHLQIHGKIEPVKAWTPQTRKLVWNKLKELISL